MFCVKCGAHATSPAAFCGNCGSPFASAPDPGHPQTPTYPPTQPQAYQPTAYSPTQAPAWDGAPAPYQAAPSTYNYGHPPYQGSYPYPASYPEARAAGNGFSIAALVLGGLAFFFLPVVLGPMGIILAVIGKSKRESKAGIALTVAILGTVLGFIIGALIGVMTY